MTLATQPKLTLEDYLEYKGVLSQRATHHFNPIQDDKQKRAISPTPASYDVTEPSGLRRSHLH